MKQTIILIGEQQRQFAINILLKLPFEPVYEVVIKEHRSTRNLEQNAKMWAMLTDISEQLLWYGEKLSKEEWKCIFSASIHKQKVVPGLDSGFVVMAQSTSKMCVKEFSEMIELITAFGCQRGIKFQDYDD